MLHSNKTRANSTYTLCFCHAVTFLPPVDRTIVQTYVPHSGREIWLILSYFEYALDSWLLLTTLIYALAISTVFTLIMTKIK